MKIFMTGATGFIGSWVAMRLLGRGHQVTAMARRPAKVPSLWTQPGMTCLEGDMSDSVLLRRGLRGADACIHIALGWGDTPTDMLSADTKTTITLLELAKDAGVSRFLDTSSTAAYGPFSARMDETTPLRPDNLYGATKAASEAYVLAVGATSPMSCNVIRPGYTFGDPVLPDAPTQPDDRFRTIARDIFHGRGVKLKRGDGTQFISASDLAELYARVIESELNREVFLGLSPRFTAWSDIADFAKKDCGSASTITLDESNDAPCLFELKKMKDHFGLEFEPQEALHQHIRWCLEQAK